MGVVLRIGPPDRDPTGKPGERERAIRCSAGFWQQLMTSFVMELVAIDY